MKKLSLPEQRSLYEAYKKTRLRQAYDSMAILKTGTHQSPRSKELLEQAKVDILNFAGVFEEKLVHQVKEELSNIQ